MPITLYAISPKNKVKVPVGVADLNRREAIFPISQARFFQEANCFGRDEKILPKKAIDWCWAYTFNLWDGRTYKVSRSDFMGYCWRYPRRDDKDYRANPGNFCPKLVISVDVAEMLNRRQKEEADKEMVIEAMK